jgi:outer membrane murein-binding lipoprotein Lpp
MTTNPPVTVTYTLEDLFTRFERNINEKIDKQSAEVKEQLAKVDQKIDKQSAEVKEQFAKVDQKIDKQSAEFKEQFAKVDQKIERQSTEFKEQFAKVDQKIERQSSEITQQFTEVNQKLLKLEIGQSELAGDIKALDATVAGINKRIDNTEFFNRSVAVTLVAAAST